MEKKKLLKRLSALGFAMYECRLYCDTHPNDTEALQMLNDYKSKYKSVKAEFEKEYGPLTLNGYNSDEWLIDTPCLNTFCLCQMYNKRSCLSARPFIIISFLRFWF